MFFGFLSKIVLKLNNHALANGGRELKKTSQSNKGESMKKLIVILFFALLQTILFTVGTN